MIANEIRKIYLNGGTLLASFSFYALALSCFSIALGPQQSYLNLCGPALLWILAILTLLFITPLLLKAEYEEGLLDEVLLQPFPSAFYFLAKIAAEILLLGFPLLGLGAFFSFFFLLSLTETTTLLLTLLIGFPALSALGILGGLLTLQAQGGNLLISVLILPLAIPLVLLSLSVIEMTRLGLETFSSFCLLTSISILLVGIAIGAAHWALIMVAEG